MSAPTAAVDTAIVFALAVEADAFERLVSRRRDTQAARFSFSSGEVAGRPVAWCVSGVGRTAAAEATRHLIAGHRPRLVISAGFAGGLDPRLRRGEAVRPGIALAEGSPMRLGLSAAAQPPGSGPLAIVTVDRVAATVRDKWILGETTGAQLVDMETFAVAEQAAAAGRDCAGVRVVSDDASETLPAEIARLAEPQSRLRRWGAVVGVVGRRPGAVADLWRLWERSLLDSRTLAHAVVELLRNRG